MKKISSTLLVMFVFMATSTNVFAHCQVPCGIYTDHARVDAMLEDVITIEKAAKQINELSEKTDAYSKHQLIRWTLNKEQHAQKIISTISDYYLTQRVKSSQSDYVERLKNHHAVIVNAMLAKQKISSETMANLKKSVETLKKYYPKPKHDHK